MATPCLAATLVHLSPLLSCPLHTSLPLSLWPTSPGPPLVPPPLAGAALELEGVHNARVAPQPDAVSIHIYGTPKGSCPPGTALKVPDNTSSAAPPEGSDADGSTAEPPVGTIGSVGFLLSPNGTAIDLSRSLVPR